MVPVARTEKGTEEANVAERSGAGAGRGRREQLGRKEGRDKHPRSSRQRPGRSDKVRVFKDRGVAAGSLRPRQEGGGRDLGSWPRPHS